MNTTTPGSIINQNPRPRLLIRGFEGKDEIVRGLSLLCPTVRRIDRLSEVRQAEWDVLVTDQRLHDSGGQYAPDLRLQDHIFVVFVRGGEDGFITVEELQDPRCTARSVPRHVSQELFRVGGLPDRIATLTHEQLEPVLIKRQLHEYFEISRTASEHEALTIDPFISTAAHKVLAGRYKRSLSSEAWLLPSDTPDLLPWVRAALAEWHTLAPDRFPGIPDWTESDEWLTSSERSLRERLREVNQRREDILRELTAVEADIRQKLRKASEEADNYERALLTTQSDKLVGSVIKALRELGFSVIDADQQAQSGDHLEDIRIEDSSTPGWIALGEIKGYTKGAKTEALTQFLRFNMRYVQRTGNSPNASWYIVNQFLSRDPGTRQPPLHGKDEDVAAFAAAGGLVIDTVSLFKLLSCVRDGRFTTGEARDMLRSSTGHFNLDPDQT